MTRAGLALRALLLLSVVVVPVLSLQVPAVRGGFLSGITWLRDAGPAGVAAYLAVYSAAALVMAPYALFAAAAGFTYGFGPGLLLASPAGMLASTTAFLVGRIFLRRAIEGRNRRNPIGRVLGTAAARHGFQLVLLVRLSPVFPQSAMSYVLSPTPLRVSHFSLGTLLGLFPITVAQVYLGSLVKDAAEILEGSATPAGPLRWVVLGGLGLVTLGTTVALARLARRSLRSLMEQSVDEWRPPAPP